MFANTRHSVFIVMLALAVIGLPGLLGAHQHEGHESGDDGPGELKPVAESPEDVAPLKVGDKVPNVTVLTVEGKKIELSKALGDGPSVVVFYRGGWCPYCNRHLADLRTIDRQLGELGYNILAIAPDRPAKMKAQKQEHDYGYRLLADPEARAIRAFGLAFHVDEPTHEKLLGYGIDLAEHSGRDHRILPVPAAYLIDDEGVIRWAHWDANYRERVKPAELLSAAHKVVDKSGVEAGAE